MGLFFEDDSESLMWAKQKFFDKGISPHEFKKCQIKDIRDVLDISSEINSKLKREQEIQNIIAKQNG